MLELVMSGGQTGADQAGLRIAKQFRIPPVAGCHQTGRPELDPAPILNNSMA